MKVYSQLEEAQIQSKTTAQETALATARVGGVWWNTDTSKVIVSDGTILRSLLRNDQFCVHGNSATAAENIRVHRGDSELLQLLLGNDSTAEGTKSNAIAQLDVRLRNWTDGTQPTASTANKGRVGFNTSTSEIQVDNGTSIVSIGSGGGSLLITDITRGENIPAGGAPVYIAERPFITITSSTNTIPFRKSGVNYPGTITAGTYLFDTQSNIDVFVAALQACVTGAGIVGSTVTASFSQSTRKFTFTGTSTIDIMWNSQTTNSAATTLGYSTASDPSGTTHTADNEIDDAGTGLSTKAFMFQAHADFLQTSKAYSGFDVEGGAYLTTGSVYKGEVDTSAHNDGLELGDLYIAKAEIVIDSTNNKIDWTDGTVRATTLTSATHIYPYDTLVADIKTQLDASASSLTFTVAYYPVTDKLTITGSSALTFLNGTGVNSATSFLVLTGGFAASDTASQAPHTSTNPIQKKGRIVSATSTALGRYSSEIGFAVEQNRVFSQLDTESSYINILTTPNDWLATPLDKDFSEEGTLVAQYENSTGYGVRVFVEDGVGEDYHLQYKRGHGSAWIDSTTLIAFSDGTVGAGENLAGNYQLFPKVIVSETTNRAVIALTRYDNGTSNYRVYAYYSTDLDTWTKANGEGTDDSIIDSGSADFFVMDMHVRAGKCVIAMQNSAATGFAIAISDDSGSGFTAFDTVDLSGSMNFQYLFCCFVRIQYFPAEVGINQYRIVIMGREDATDRGRILYTKGDGTTIATITAANTFIDANTIYPLTCAMDTTGDGNAIIFTGANESTYDIYRCLLSTTYSGGVLTTNNFSSVTINPNGFTQFDRYNGYTSASDNHNLLNQNLRALIIGSKHYHLFNLNAGRELYLSYSIDSGATYSSITLNNGSATQLVFEQCMFYVSSINKIVIAYKFCDAVADNLTEGKIYAALINLSSTGVPTVEVGFTQVDGGSAGTVFQGFLTGSASTNAVNLSWEHYNGSRDTLYSNKFI